MAIYGLERAVCLTSIGKVTMISVFSKFAEIRPFASDRAFVPQIFSKVQHLLLNLNEAVYASFGALYRLMTTSCIAKLYINLSCHLYWNCL